MKLLARHKWREGSVISEYYEEETEDRPLIVRFTATIRGWQRWRIYQGKPYENMAEEVCQKVVEIRDLIDSGDEEIFSRKGYFIDWR